MRVLIAGLGFIVLFIGVTLADTVGTDDRDLARVVASIAFLSIGLCFISSILFHGRDDVGLFHPLAFRVLGIVFLVGGPLVSVYGLMISIGLVPGESGYILYRGIGAGLCVGAFGWMVVGISKQKSER